MKKIYKQLLPQSKEVLATQVKVEGSELIVEVEFKEKFRPKDGDFVSTKDGRVFIYNGRGTIFQYGAYCGINIYDKIIVNDPLLSGWTGQNGCRFATDEEKRNFLDRLEMELGKRWNAETKQLEDTSKATADIPREKILKLKDGYMIIPFNAEIARDIQEGRREGYICTRKEHLPVRVICWDSKCPDDYLTPKPIVALVSGMDLKAQAVFMKTDIVE